MHFLILAGLSVAQVISKQYSVCSKLLVCCGPGNNGGDGLVAARHLCHFGYPVSVWYPKRSQKDIYQRLTIQCQDLDIAFIEPDDLSKQASNCDVLVDAVFGISVH